MRPPRAVIIGALLLLAIPVQTGLLGRFALLGAKPELLTLIVVAVAMLSGPLEGALTGLAAGLILDSLTALPDGLGTLVLALTGLVVGRLRALIQRPSAWVPAVTVGTATVLSLAVYALLSFLFGSPVGVPARTIARIFLAGAYGAILTPFIYPMLQRLLTDRPKEVIGSVLVRR